MNLFVYGTLRSAALMQAVAGGGVLRSTPASLPGYAVYPLAGNVVPFIRPTQSGQAEGIIWEDVTPAQIARLNTYEGAFGYRLDPVVVTTDAGPREVRCYIPPPDLPVGEGVWSLQAWEADHLAPALLAAAELFSNDPLPDHAQLRAMWPMIEARAWSKHRATARPANNRHDAAPDDFRIEAHRPAAGRFFRFESVDVTHSRFDGAQSGVLAREGFVGVDAAIVLPYDPVRDRVLLIEQARLGPRLRHDPNPWMLEPVAGIVDAREAPEDAARREAAEEAGVTFSELAHAGSFYASPGATTDFFYSYVGICDLPQDAPYFGGLPQENEDLRVHPMTLDTALELVDSGEIATGPALFLLYWLLRHREKFQKR